MLRITLTWMPTIDWSHGIFWGALLTVPLGYWKNRCRVARDFRMNLLSVRVAVFMSSNCTFGRHAFLFGHVCRFFFLVCLHYWLEVVSLVIFWPRPSLPTIPRSFLYYMGPGPIPCKPGPSLAMSGEWLLGAPCSLAARTEHENSFSNKLGTALLGIWRPVLEALLFWYKKLSMAICGCNKWCSN